MDPFIYFYDFEDCFQLDLSGNPLTYVVGAYEPLTEGAPYIIYPIEEPALRVCATLITGSTSTATTHYTDVNSKFDDCPLCLEANGQVVTVSSILNPGINTFNLIADSRFKKGDIFHLNIVYEDSGDTLFINSPVIINEVSPYVSSGSTIPSFINYVPYTSYKDVIESKGLYYTSVDCSGGTEDIFLSYQDIKQYGTIVKVPYGVSSCKKVVSPLISGNYSLISGVTTVLRSSKIFNSCEECLSTSSASNIDEQLANVSYSTNSLTDFSEKNNGFIFVGSGLTSADDSILYNVGNIVSVNNDGTVDTNFNKPTFGNFTTNNNNYLYCNGSENFNFEGDFTVEFWLNFSSFDTNSGIVSYYNSDDSEGWEIRFDSSNIAFDYNGDSITSTFEPNSGQWNHIAVVRDGSDLTLFLNGTGETTSSVTDTITASTATTLYVCSNYSGGTFIDGKITDVRITQKAVYTGDFTPQTSPLTIAQSEYGNISSIPSSATTLLLNFKSSGDVTFDSSVYRNKIYSRNPVIYNTSQVNTVGVVFDDIYNGEPLKEFTQIDLPEGYLLKFFGKEYSSIYINSNSYLTFDQGSDSEGLILPNEIPSEIGSSGVFISTLGDNVNDDNRTYINRISTGTTYDGESFLVKVEAGYSRLLPVAGKVDDGLCDCIRISSVDGANWTITYPKCSDGLIFVTFTLRPLNYYEICVEASQTIVATQSNITLQGINEINNYSTLSAQIISHGCQNFLWEYNAMLPIEVGGPPAVDYSFVGGTNNPTCVACDDVNQVTNPTFNIPVWPFYGLPVFHPWANTGSAGNAWNYFNHPIIGDSIRVSELTIGNLIRSNGFNTGPGYYDVSFDLLWEFNVSNCPPVSWLNNRLAVYLGNLNNVQFIDAGFIDPFGSGNVMGGLTRRTLSFLSLDNAFLRFQVLGNCPNQVYISNVCVTYIGPPPPPVPCNCYTINYTLSTADSSQYTLVRWKNCAGNPLQTWLAPPPNDTVSICAQQNTIDLVYNNQFTTISPAGATCDSSSDFCNGSNYTNVCICYESKWNENGNDVIVYIDCQGTQRTLFQSLAAINERFCAAFIISGAQLTNVVTFQLGIPASCPDNCIQCGCYHVINPTTHSNLRLRRQDCLDNYIVGNTSSRIQAGFNGFLCIKNIYEIQAPLIVNQMGNCSYDNTQLDFVCPPPTPTPTFTPFPQINGCVVLLETNNTTFSGTNIWIYDVVQNQSTPLYLSANTVANLVDCAMSNPVGGGNTRFFQIYSDSTLIRYRFNFTTGQFIDGPMTSTIPMVTWSTFGATIILNGLGIEPLQNFLWYSRGNQGQTNNRIYRFNWVANEHTGQFIQLGNQEVVFGDIIINSDRSALFVLTRRPAFINGIQLYQLFFRAFDISDINNIVPIVDENLCQPNVSDFCFNVWATTTNNFEADMFIDGGQLYIVKRGQGFVERVYTMSQSGVLTLTNLTVPDIGINSARRVLGAANFPLCNVDQNGNPWTWATPTPTPTVTKTKTPTKSVTPTKTQTKTPTKTPTKTATHTPTKTKTPTPTRTVPGCRCHTVTKSNAGQGNYQVRSCITNTIVTRPINGNTGILDCFIEGTFSTNFHTITSVPTANLCTNCYGTTWVCGDETNCPTPTPTPTITKTKTPTRTQTKTPTPTKTQTPTPTKTKTPTKSVTPTRTQTKTPTPTFTPFPCIVGCAVFVIYRDNSQILSYNVLTNTLLPIPNMGVPPSDCNLTDIAASGIANTWYRLAGCQTYPGIFYQTVDFETCTPPTTPSIYIPTGTVGQGLGCSLDGLSAYYSKVNGTTGEIHIFTPPSTSALLFTLPTGRVVSGDILATTTGKIIVTTRDTNSLYVEQYTNLDDTSSGISFDGEINLTSLNNTFIPGTQTDIFVNNGIFYITKMVFQVGSPEQLWTLSQDGSTLTQLPNIPTAGFEIYGLASYPECNDFEFEFVDPRCAPLYVQYGQDIGGDTGIPGNIYPVIVTTQTNQIINFPGLPANQLVQSSGARGRIGIARTFNYETDSGRIWIYHTSANTLNVGTNVFIDEWNYSFVQGTGFVINNYNRRITVGNSLNIGNQTWTLGCGLAALDNNTLVGSRAGRDIAAYWSLPDDIVLIDISQPGNINLTSAQITPIFHLPVNGSVIQTTNQNITIPAALGNKVSVWGNLTVTDTQKIIIKGKTTPNVTNSNPAHILLQIDLLGNLEYAYQFPTTPTNPFANRWNSVFLYNQQFIFNRVTDDLGVWNNAAWDPSNPTIFTPVGAGTAIQTGGNVWTNTGFKDEATPILIPSPTGSLCPTVDLPVNVTNYIP